MRSCHVLCLCAALTPPPVCMQEFCLFAVVGLVSDFFLQMFFFTTVLSIDIRRMEVSPPPPHLLTHQGSELS